MGRQIPHQIKTKVLREWLEGIPRDTIASDNTISNGSVTSIIQFAKGNNPDIDLFREIALKLKKENIDLNYFASAFRLKKTLDRLEIPEEKLETLIEEIDAHCFREGKSEKEFVSKIDEVFDIAADLNSSIWNINSKINQKAMEIEKLDKKIAGKQEDLNKAIESYGITVDDLEDFRLSRPLRDKIALLKNRLTIIEWI